MGQAVFIIHVRDPRKCAMIAPDTFHDHQAPGLWPGPEKNGLNNRQQCKLSYQTAPKPKGRVFRTMIITAITRPTKSSEMGKRIQSVVETCTSMRWKEFVKCTV